MITFRRDAPAAPSEAARLRPTKRRAMLKASASSSPLPFPATKPTPIMKPSIARSMAVAMTRPEAAASFNLPLTVLTRSIRTGAQRRTFLADDKRRSSSGPHSSSPRYLRTLAGLPWQGIPVTLSLRVRRFFCVEATCERLSSRSGYPAWSLTTRVAPAGWMGCSPTSRSTSEARLERGFFSSSACRRRATRC